MGNPKTCTKQYYVIRYQRGENPHWYDGVTRWSLKDAEESLRALKKHLRHERVEFEAKVVVRTEITNTLDVDLPI